jgi:RsiW-degrading membrane proteinase PrsW (M82 family)
MSPFIKYLVVFTLIVIVYNLFKAFYHLSNRKSNPKEVVRSLAIRVGLSITLFLSLLLASYLGFIQPHGLLPVDKSIEQNIK